MKSWLVIAALSLDVPKPCFTGVAKARFWLTHDGKVMSCPTSGIEDCMTICGLSAISVKQHLEIKAW